MSHLNTNCVSWLGVTVSPLDCVPLASSSQDYCPLFPTALGLIPIIDPLSSGLTF